MMKWLSVVRLALLGFPVGASAAPNWDRVDAAIGRAGAVQAGGVHRYSFPRSDLEVTLDSVAIKPALALGSWAAFQPMGDDAMVMGDLVLTHEEVNPVMAKLFSSGFTITALHNHLLRSAPATMYMHIAAHGDPVRLASALRAALALSHTPLAVMPAAPVATDLPGLDVAALDGAMGRKGKIAGGTYQFSVPRAERLTDAGMEIPSAMGVAHAINFQPTGAGKAAITGDLVLIAREVPEVLRTLRANGIEVTALHNHMLEDEPRLFYVHFWANDDARRLARAMHEAVAKTAVAK